MNIINLIQVSDKYINQLEDYKQEMLETNTHFHGCGSLGKCSSIQEYLDRVDKFKNPETVENGYVTSVQYIYYRPSDDKIVGMLQLRLELNDNLLFRGGHIGYSVRPSEQDYGYATDMLSEALEICKSRGLSKVLITCNADNIPSKRVIMHNGGIYENTVNDGELIERYWILL